CRVATRSAPPGSARRRFASVAPSAGRFSRESVSSRNERPVAELTPTTRALPGCYPPSLFGGPRFRWAMAMDTDRPVREEHWALAEARVAQGERTVAHQRRIVAELDGEGHDSRMARELLTQFQELLALHVADRDRLLKELGRETPKP